MSTPLERIGRWIIRREVLLRQIKSIHAADIVTPTSPRLPMVMIAPSPNATVASEKPRSSKGTSVPTTAFSSPCADSHSRTSDLYFAWMYVCMGTVMRLHRKGAHKTGRATVENQAARTHVLGKPRTAHSRRGPPQA